ncbi:MAG: hypothetical protein L6R38_006612 [Xanthoria sp. 2 TBL-2021]|nr:MAG: hypothetical protein L6R38_006612 [Xanthoria sp. 2 TBL-2021]
MVLETSSISDSYDASPDTPDPYDTSSQTSTDFSSIDLSKLPHPPPIIGPLFGYTNTYIANLATMRLHYHTEAMQRRLSQKEREAIVFHAYKSATISSIGLPIACTFGMFRAFSTRENYRYPLWGELKKEGGWWDGSRIRIMGQTVSEGSNARFLMHGFRSTGYLAAAIFFGGLMINSYAATVAAVGELRDPRLKDITNTTMAKNMQQKGDPEAMKPQSKDPTGQGDTSVSDLWKKHRKDIGAFDDASPSAGADGYGGEVERLGGSNTGIMSDAQMRVQETRQQALPNDSPTENRPSTFRLDKVEKQPRSLNDTFDDASPTADGGADQQQGQGGNAWDRIRRQAQNPSSRGKQKAQRWNPVKKEQQEGSTTGDSFAFSSDDEQRQLARDEAQNEFDARVERERQGGNFNENRGKKW